MTRTRHDGPYQATAAALTTAGGVEIASIVNHHGVIEGFATSIAQADSIPVGYLLWLTVEAVDRSDSHVTVSLAGDLRTVDAGQPIVLRAARTPVRL